MFPLDILLGLSFCPDLWVGDQSWQSPLLQMGMRPGLETQASFGDSALRVPLFQNSETRLPSCSGFLENYLAGV